MKFDFHMVFVIKLLLDDNTYGLQNLLEFECNHFTSIFQARSEFKNSNFGGKSNELLIQCRFTNKSDFSMRAKILRYCKVGTSLFSHQKLSIPSSCYVLSRNFERWVMPLTRTFLCKIIFLHNVEKLKLNPPFSLCINVKNYVIHWNDLKSWFAYTYICLYLTHFTCEKKTQKQLFSSKFSCRRLLFF